MLIETAGAPHATISQNTTAGGNEPQDPGATGIQPNPKHVAVKRFQSIGPRQYRKGGFTSKGNKRGSRLAKAYRSHTTASTIMRRRIIATATPAWMNNRRLAVTIRETPVGFGIGCPCRSR